jgi:hypothetical protein
MHFKRNNHLFFLLTKLSSFIDWCCYYTQVSYTGSSEPPVYTHPGNTDNNLKGKKHTKLRAQWVETRITRDQYCGCIATVSDRKLLHSHSVELIGLVILCVFFRAAYEKNFRLRDKNHAPFKLNGQSRTAFGLLKASELQRLSVTVEVLRVGVMIVWVIKI